MKTRSPGFTLLELMVTVAVVALVAAAAIPVMRSAARNASVGSTGFDLQLRLQGLKTRAMGDQEELLAVLVDAPGNDGSNCVFGLVSQCATLFTLRNPTPAWTLPGFDPAAPGAQAEVDDIKTLGKGIRLANDPALDKVCFVPGLSGGPRPFERVKLFDGALTGACGGRACVAVRFRPNGTVVHEPLDPTTPAPQGLAFAVGSDLVRTTTATAECRAVLVTFPSGIVKSFVPRNAP